MGSDNSEDFKFQFGDESPPIPFSTWSAAINKEIELPDHPTVDPVKTGPEFQNQSVLPILSATRPKPEKDIDEATEVQLSLFEEEESDFFKVYQR